MGLFGWVIFWLCEKLDEVVVGRVDVEMELFFLRLILDVIGKVVFNYEFDFLINDIGIVEVSLFNFFIGGYYLFIVFMFIIGGFFF